MLQPRLGGIRRSIIGLLTTHRLPTQLPQCTPPHLSTPHTVTAVVTQHISDIIANLYYTILQLRQVSSSHLLTAWVLALIVAVRSSAMSTSAIGVELA
ncbi:MAG TPA: hypothetical protein VE862_11205 [Candidatus Acidoferrum sp.]|nr:hypothetical protein [Candidatus Acidoferrum sp.]